MEKQGADQGHDDQRNASTAPISPLSPLSPTSPAPLVSPTSPTSPTPSLLFSASKAPLFQPENLPQSKSPHHFVENQHCPLPEVVVGGGNLPSTPEPVENLNQLNIDVQDDASSTRPVMQPPVQPDFGDPRSATQVYVDPSKSWIAKNKTWVIVGLAAVVAILIGVTVGVVITERHKAAAASRRVYTSSPPRAPAPTRLARLLSFGHGEPPTRELLTVITRTCSAASGPVSTTGPSLPSSTTSSADSPVSNAVPSSSLDSAFNPTESSASVELSISVESSAATELSTSAASTQKREASQTSIPSACASSSFIHNANWIGLSDVSPPWKTKYSAAKDAASCCSICYGSQPAGCDGWLFIPNPGSPGTVCTMIVGGSGAKNDSTCPSGHIGVTISTDAKNASHVGGMGPCGTAN